MKKQTIELTKAEIRILVAALDSPSVGDAKIAKLYYRLAALL